MSSMTNATANIYCSVLSTGFWKAHTYTTDFIIMNAAKHLAWWVGVGSTFNDPTTT